MTRDSAFGVAATAAVVLGLALAFLAIGSPSHNRQVSLDEARVADLKAISLRIAQAYQLTKQVPTREPDVGLHLDPVTREPYPYSPLRGTRYRLCAIFDAPSEASDNRDAGILWEHGSGLRCFTRNAAMMEY